MSREASTDALKEEELVSEASGGNNAPAQAKKAEGTPVLEADTPGSTVLMVQETPLKSSHDSAGSIRITDEARAGDVSERQLESGVSRLDMSPDENAPLSTTVTVPSPATPPEPIKATLEEAEGVEEEWPLKEIAWPPLPPPPAFADSHGSMLSEAPGLTIRVITQNLNGPCSLIALCNVLILRGDIVVTPSDRPSVSYSYLAQLLADYLLRKHTSTGTGASATIESDLSSALSVLPTTRYGLTLNPRFGSIDGFNSTPGQRGELAIFELAGVPLLHGWVVDPQEGDLWDLLVESLGDYDAAVEKVVAGQVVAGGDLDFAARGKTEQEILEMVERRSRWTPQEEKVVTEAHSVKTFLDQSRTQLTYHGLMLLSTHLAPSSLSALFRNSHLSVIYRRPTLPGESNPDQSLRRRRTGEPELFTLVTDSSFANEPEVVWESLVDVDGSGSEFYDGCLRMSSVRGGNWVGRERRRDSEIARGHARAELESRRHETPSDQPNEDADFALAQQLQHEEDERSQRRNDRDRELQAGRQQPQQHHPSRSNDPRRRSYEAAQVAPSVLAPGALSAGPEAVVAPTSTRRRRDKTQDDKDKCMVM